MNSYTITIAPNDNSGNATTLVVDTSGSEVRITDVHLHATDGLAGGQMPTVDFGLLLRAITGSKAPAIEATPVRAVRASQAGERVDAQAPTTESTAPAPRTRRRARQAAPATAEPAKRVRARATKNAASKKASAAPAKAAKSASAKKTAKAAARSGERVYRRMPEDFAAVYGQTGSTAAIADHYSVPRHTAQGWVRRIRAMNAATPATAE